MKTLSLSDKLQNLYESQLKTWPTFKATVDNLNQIETKNFKILDTDITVQFNPARAKSTLAKIDSKSISERKCFLCPDNLPTEQTGLIWHDDFLVLCNPYPIFPKHFTVSKAKHIEQNLETNEAELVSLIQELNGKFTVLFNGAKAGASAPDHFHFQICPTSALPIFNRLNVALPTTAVSTLSLFDRPLYIIYTASPEEATQELHHLAINEIKTKCNDFGLVNVLGTMLNGKICLVVAQRAKHRPNCYFATAESERLMVSPASVEIGGVLITAREEDFNKINPEIIQTIYQDVLLK